MRDYNQSAIVGVTSAGAPDSAAADDQQMFYSTQQNMHLARNSRNLAKG